MSSEDFSVKASECLTKLDAVLTALLPLTEAKDLESEAPQILQTHLRSLSSRLTHLNQDVKVCNTLHAEVDELRKTSSTTESELLSLRESSKTELNVLRVEKQAEIDKIREDNASKIAKLQGQLDDRDGNLTRLKEQIDSNQKELSKLRKDHGSHGVEIGTLKAEHSEKLSRLQKTCDIEKTKNQSFLTELVNIRGDLRTIRTSMTERLESSIQHIRELGSLGKRTILNDMTLARDRSMAEMRLAQDTHTAEIQTAKSKLQTTHSQLVTTQSKLATANLKVADAEARATSAEQALQKLRFQHNLQLVELEAKHKQDTRIRDAAAVENLRSTVAKHRQVRHRQRNTIHQLQGARVYDHRTHQATVTSLQKSNRSLRKRIIDIKSQATREVECLKTDFTRRLQEQLQKRTKEIEDAYETPLAWLKTETEAVARLELDCTDQVARNTAECEARIIDEQAQCKQTLDKQSAQHAKEIREYNDLLAMKEIERKEIERTKTKANAVLLKETVNKLIVQIKEFSQMVSRHGVEQRTSHEAASSGIPAEQPNPVPSSALASVVTPIAVPRPNAATSVVTQITLPHSAQAGRPDTLAQMLPTLLRDSFSNPAAASNARSSTQSRALLIPPATTPADLMATSSYPHRESIQDTSSTFVNEQSRSYSNDAESPSQLDPPPGIANDSALSPSLRPHRNLKRGDTEQSTSQAQKRARVSEDVEAQPQLETDSAVPSPESNRTANTSARVNPGVGNYAAICASQTWSLFHPEWMITDNEQDQLMTQLRGLFNTRSVQDISEAIDKHVVGNFRKIPADPPPCLMAQLYHKSAGPGGPNMTQRSCPYCKQDAERICVYAVYAPGVTSGFGPRIDGIVTNTVWDPEPQPRTTVMGGKDVRWILRKR